MPIEYRNVADLKNNEQNPRKITEEKFEKLKKSIREFPRMLSLRL
jgi:ParB-like chromosome segregation protein Spo0J